MNKFVKYLLISSLVTTQFSVQELIRDNGLTTDTQNVKTPHKPKLITSNSLKENNKPLYDENYLISEIKNELENRQVKKTYDGTNYFEENIKIYTTKLKDEDYSMLEEINIRVKGYSDSSKVNFMNNNLYITNWEVLTAYSRGTLLDLSTKFVIENFWISQKELSLPKITANNKELWNTDIPFEISLNVDDLVGLAPNDDVKLEHIYLDIYPGEYSLDDSIIKTISSILVGKDSENYTLDKHESSIEFKVSQSPTSKILNEINDILSGEEQTERYQLDYTEKDWDHYISEKNKSKSVLKADNVDKETAQEALKSLKNAISNMKKNAPLYFSTLKSLCFEERKTSRNQYDYSQSDWLNYTTSLTTAEIIIKSNSTISETEKALHKLQEAVSLIKKNATMNFTNLKKLINSGKEKRPNKSQYHIQNWTIYDDILEKSENFLKEENFTYEAVKKHLHSLQHAADILEQDSKSSQEYKELSDLVTKENRRKESQYYSQSWPSFQMKLQESKKMLTNPNSTKNDLKKLQKDLEQVSALLIRNSGWFEFKYATITKKGYSLWKDLYFKEKKDVSDKYFHQTFKIKVIYDHYNNSTYYSLYNKKDEWIGYINSKAIKSEMHASGYPISHNKYVTILKKNYPIWQYLDFQKKINNTSNLINRTFYAKEGYNHLQGSHYLHLFDQHGIEIGFVNANSTKQGATKGGAYLNNNNYVTITKKNYSIWSDFNFKKKRGNTTSFYNRTLYAKGKYYHFNGSTYLSVYNNKNKWIGYVNMNSTKISKNKEGGTYLNNNNYVTITKKNYSIWSDFNFKKKIGNTTSFYNHTLYAKGKYYHFNGSTYLSVYNNKNKWIGYVNMNSTKISKNKGGIALKKNKFVRLSKRNYTIWNDLNFKKKNGDTKTYYNARLRVKVFYNHFNGITYYSIYNPQGKWIGYVNKAALK